MMHYLILIVSNPPMPEISNYFAEDVYDVRLATSAESMSALLAAQAPDVVIIDPKSISLSGQNVRTFLNHQAKPKSPH